VVVRPPGTGDEEAKAETEGVKGLGDGRGEDDDGSEVLW